MKVEEISEQEFYTFMKNYNDMYHFMHDELYYDYVKEHTKTYLLGLKEEANLIGVSLISEYPFLRSFNAMSTHSGPVIEDFTNEKLERFIKGIDDFAKSKGAVTLTFSPYTIYQMRDRDGNVIEDDPKNNEEIIRIFSRNGFKHHGFTKQMIFGESIRFLSVVDISGSLDEILKNMDRTTRYNTRQSEMLPLKLKYLDESEYDRFIEIYKDTEKRLGFDEIPESRIKAQLKSLQDKAYIVLSQIDLDQYIDELTEELKELTESLEELEQKESITRGEKKRLNEQKNLVKSRKKRLKSAEEHREQYGGLIDLSVGMYYYNNNEMVYLYSGSYPEHSQYLGTNFVTWEMIKKAKELGLERFNMFGITGNFHEDASDYGVFKFKQGYNASIEELPGTFSIVNRPVIYKAKQLINKVR